MALSSPDSTSPALISRPGFGAGSACCAEAAGGAHTAAIAATKARRLPNRRIIMGVISVGNMSEQSPLPHGCGQRAFVEIVELAADRDPVGQPRHLDAGLLQQVGDVMRGGLAVHGRI